MGMLFTTGNSAGLISSNVYPAKTGPRFFEGHGVALGFAFMAIVCAVIITTANRRENARRDRVYGEVAVDGSDANPTKVLSAEKRTRWGLDGLSETEVIELGDLHPGKSCCLRSSQFFFLPLPLIPLAHATHYFTGYRYII